MAKVFTTCLWAMIVISLGFIIHFGLFSVHPLSPLMRELSRLDLILHGIAFACLSIPALLLFRPMIWAASGLFLLGFCLELAQWVWTTREASIADVAANAAGIVLAAVIVLTLKRANFAFLRPLLDRVN